MLTREDYDKLTGVDAKLALEVLWAELVKTRTAVTTWYTACEEKDARHASNLRYYRKYNDELWQHMNATRALLGRLRTRAAAGESLTVPLENEMNRLYGILKKAKKGERR